MRAEHLYPFAEACGDVVRSIFDVRPESGAIAAKTDLGPSYAINLIAEIEGDLQGLALVGMPMAAADRIASKILQVPASSFDLEGTQALAEFGHMVCSLALERLAEQGFACTATRPSMVRGKGGGLNRAAGPCLSLQVQVNGLGALAVEVSLRDQRQQVA